MHGNKSHAAGRMLGRARSPSQGTEKFRAAWIKGFSIQTLFTLPRLRMHDLDLLRREKISIMRRLNLK